MFLLESEGEIGDAPALAAALEAGFGPALVEDSPAPRVTAEGWPELASLTVDLTGCDLRGRASPFATAPATDRRDGPTAKTVAITGDTLRIGGTAVALTIDGTGAAFSFGSTPDERDALALERLEAGSLDLFVRKDEMEERLKEGLDAKAKKQGARILAVEMDLSPQGEDGIFVTMRVKLKMMFKADLRVTGVLLLGEDLVLTVDQAFAKGEGMAGKMVAGLVAPQLKSLEGKEFPLGNLLPGGVELRDVALRTEGGVGISGRLAMPDQEG